jgi:hypothetical protein
MNNQLNSIENAPKSDFQNLTEEEVAGWGNILFQSDTPLEEKKKALETLAQVGNLNAYKYLKKYAEQPDKELENLATMALGECTILLHDDMSDEIEHYFVYTGVGPKNNLTRVFFVLIPREGKTFEPDQLKIIEKEVINVTRDLKCEIEWFDFKPDYSSFSLLIPTYIAIATIIEKCIENCNHFGDFVLKEYYCETGIPEEKELDEIIQIVRKGK